MIAKRLIKRGLLVATGIFLLLFATLVVHLYYVTQPQEKPNATMQLGRIDFNEAIDSALSRDIHHSLLHLPGVQNVRVNATAQNATFIYDLKTTSGDRVFHSLTDRIPVDATRFVPDPDAAASGCPIIDKDTFSNRLAQAVKKVFHE